MYIFFSVFIKKNIMVVLYCDLLDPGVNGDTYFSFIGAFCWWFIIFYVCNLVNHISEELINVVLMGCACALSFIEGTNFRNPKSLLHPCRGFTCALSVENLQKIINKWNMVVFNMICTLIYKVTKTTRFAQFYLN